MKTAAFIAIGTFAVPTAFAATETDPLLDALETSDERRQQLVKDLKRLASPEEGGSHWSQAITQKLAGEKGESEIREFLTGHGFRESDSAWLDRLPDDAPADLRTSVILLHLRQLLQQGPSNFEDQWPSWDDGDTPGEPPALDFRELAEQSDDSFDPLLESFVPGNPIYRILQKRFVEMESDLEKLREDFIGIPPIEEGDIVKPGDTFAGGRQLARRLAEEGYLDEAPDEAGESLGDDPPPVFTEQLSAAIKRFQKHHGRSVDGILGPKTLAELNRGPDDELEILRINLHRARRLPDDMGKRHVIVNIPSTRVWGFSGSEKPSLNMKTIVGRQISDRQTPVFRDIMKSVVFGPYWNIPVSIAKDEIVPAARDDHGYLERGNYEIVSSYGDSETLPVTSGNLSKVESGNLLLREKPGPGNSLGRVKFLFPNDHAIYLHDTPEDQLFEEAERDFSHGCIRVEKPADLAEFVLGPQGWDRDRIERALEESSGKTVEMEEPLNVFIIYLTVFPTWDGDGTVAFLPDIYQKDDTLLKSGKKDDGE